MATITVENGTIVTNANSYVTTTELNNYASDRNITISGDASELLIQAMDYIESLDFIGVKYTNDQSLQWPRTGVIIDGYDQDIDSIPQILKNGQMATAIAIDAGNGPLIDLPRNVKRKRVGELEVEYMDGSSSVVVSRTINAQLHKLLQSGGIMRVNKA